MNFCMVLDFAQNSDKFNFLRTSLRIAIKILQLANNYHLAVSIISYDAYLLKQHQKQSFLGVLKISCNESLEGISRNKSMVNFVSQWYPPQNFPEIFPGFFPFQTKNL